MCHVRGCPSYSHGRRPRLASVLGEGRRRDTRVLETHCAHVLLARLSDHQLLVCMVLTRQLGSYLVPLLLSNSVLVGLRHAQEKDEQYVRERIVQARLRESPAHASPLLRADQALWPLVRRRIRSSKSSSCSWTCSG